MQGTETATTTVTSILDALEAAGYISKGDEGSSSKSSSSIKNITEETADILVSYVNAIRADVSVSRVTLQQMLLAMQGQAQMPVIAEAQLQNLQTLVQLARERTGFVSEIRDILHNNINGANKFTIK